MPQGSLHVVHRNHPHSPSTGLEDCYGLSPWSPIDRHLAHFQSFATKRMPRRRTTCRHDFLFFASACLGQIPRSAIAGPVRKMLEVAGVPHKASHQRCTGRPVLLSLDHGTYCQPFGVKSTSCIFAFPVTRSLNMHNAGYSLSQASRTFQAHDEYHSIPVFKDAPTLAGFIDSRATNGLDLRMKLSMRLGDTDCGRRRWSCTGQCLGKGDRTAGFGWLVLSGGQSCL